MIDYALKLQALKSQPTHKLKEIGDQWRTPENLYWGINSLYGPFTLDLFTDAQNSKCPHFYTVEDNALTQDWAKNSKNLVVLLSLIHLIHVVHIMKNRLSLVLDTS